MNYYVNKLVEIAMTGSCPGCGPTMLPVSYNDQPDSALDSFCTCCGWHVTAGFNDSGALADVSFSSFVPPVATKASMFECALEHPEHRDNWPSPSRDEAQPDSLSTEEKIQREIEKDRHHAYLADASAICGHCGKWGPHKILEDRPYVYGQQESAALCCKCFIKIFGGRLHSYEILDGPIVIE